LGLMGYLPDGAGWLAGASGIGSRVRAIIIKEADWKSDKAPAFEGQSWLRPS